MNPEMQQTTIHGLSHGFQAVLQLGHTEGKTCRAMAFNMRNAYNNGCQNSSFDGGTANLHDHASMQLERLKVNQKLHAKVKITILRAGLMLHWFCSACGCICACAAYTTLEQT